MIFNSNTNLQSVRLNNMSKLITDITIESLAKNCPNVTSISLIRSNVNDISMKYLAQGCKQLKDICVKASPNISDEGT